ncbi:MAG: hypothetical protein QOF58_1976, partial [Pseudonocardiales bacterium]|nr:hypothetical protein [Pseudonocardiales bacterium]
SPSNANAPLVNAATARLLLREYRMADPPS